MAARTLAEIWPFFGLKVSTPQLTLVYPNDELVAALIATADEGIHDPDYSPFSVHGASNHPRSAHSRWRSFNGNAVRIFRPRGGGFFSP